MSCYVCSVKSSEISTSRLLFLKKTTCRELSGTLIECYRRYLKDSSSKYLPSGIDRMKLTPQSFINVVPCIVLFKLKKKEEEKKVHRSSSAKEIGQKMGDWHDALGASPLKIFFIFIAPFKFYLSSKRTRIYPGKLCQI